MPYDTVTLSRRTLVGAACAGCATLLTACGGSEEAEPAASSASSSSTSSGTSAAPTGNSAAASLATLADIEVGGAVSAQAPDGTKLVIVRTGESEATAYDATCPHQGCAVAPDGGEFNCPCHGSKFALADGAVLNGPAQEGLTPYAVAVTDGQVVAA